MTTFVM